MFGKRKRNNPTIAAIQINELLRVQKEERNRFLDERRKPDGIEEPHRGATPSLRDLLGITNPMKKKPKT